MHTTYVTLDTNNKNSQQQCRHHDFQMSYPTTQTTIKNNSVIITYTKWRSDESKKESKKVSTN